MFQIIRWLIILILVICLLGGLIVWLARVPITETLLSRKLSSDVTVENVSFGINRITLKDLKIENPSKAKLPYALQVRSITVQMNPLNLLKKIVYVERVKIEEPHLTVEVYNPEGTESNWLYIFKELSSSSMTNNNSPKSVLGNERSEEKTYIINRLSIINLQIDILNNNQVTPLPKIPFLEFQGLGKDRALTIAQLVRQLVIYVLDNVKSKHNLEALFNRLTSTSADIDKASRATLDSVKESVKSALKEGNDVIQRKAEEALDYLQSLFSK